VYVQNGNLVIVARNEAYHGNNYTSARLRSKSKRDFLYGRMEARIKLPTTQGIWPAFWMMPTESVYGGWPHSGEIDIMEAINQTDIIYFNLHFSNTSGNHDSNGGSYDGEGVNFADAFHTYELEWEPTRMRWYVDGVLRLTKTSWNSDTNPYPAPFGEPFYFILNTAVGGSWPGDPDGTTVFPQDMLVDYVRAYEKTP
jgi:beta-glucanase (GH16 family)